MECEKVSSDCWRDDAFGIETPRRRKRQKEEDMG